MIERVAPAAKAPEFARPALPPPRLRTADAWPWLAVPLLVLLLAVQVLVADRARLAADATWRPRIIAVCAVLRCQVPAWREPSSFHVTTRDVRPHPSVPGVLRVTATFRNDAKFEQPWPQLQLSLANVEGDALGLRRFRPRDYLGNLPADSRLGPGQSATFSLDVADPGKRAVGFNIEFR